MPMTLEEHKNFLREVDDGFRGEDHPHRNPRLEVAWSIVTKNTCIFLDDEPLDSLLNDIIAALQDSFDLGFKAAGGTIYPLNEDPSGQRREPMLPGPLDDEAPF